MNKEESKEYRDRLKEMTEVLHHHQITRGVSPEKFREILEDLGPTYIKLGQIMSMRSDILPMKYCKELMKLRSEVRPMSFEQVKAVVEESYHCPITEVFSSFEETPLGSASIAQAHRAVLKAGEQVVVKVQRQGIYDIMSRDIHLLHRAVKLLPPVNMKELVDLDMILDEMWAVAQEEMNFLTEASSIEEFFRRNQNVKYVSCPKCYREHTTTQILVMEYIDGIDLTEKEELLGEGYDLDEIGLKLADNYVKQIIEDGFFHADPHPGNLRIRDGKIVWIDMGMMGRLTERDRELTGKVVQGMAKGDTGEVLEAIMALGEFREKPDQIRLYSDIGGLLEKYGTADIGKLDIAKVMEDLMEVMKANHIAMPHGLTMLARGMTTIEGVIADISPSTNMVAVASARVKESYLSHLDIRAELNKDARTLYQSIHKTMDIPILLADMLHGYKKGQTRINLDLHSTEDLNSMLEELIRKLVFGLMIAALLIGSSIVCTTEMKPRILGIPALGMFGYVAAVIMTIYVFFITFHHKRK